MNAAAMSMLRTYADIGYISGPLLLGYLSDAVGIPAGLYVTCALLTGSALLFALFAPEVYRHPAKASTPAAVAGRN
jgi:predicted MFS family arabinose efflux permease